VVWIRKRKGRGNEGRQRICCRGGAQDRYEARGSMSCKADIVDLSKRHSKRKKKGNSGDTSQQHKEWRTGNGGPCLRLSKDMINCEIVNQLLALRVEKALGPEQK
jgi:hypothetical protein